MPKATKKAKDKKADFVKAKFKLGKGKKPANNATDTSFKARSIALPSQTPLARSLASEAGPSRVATTSRGLTIDEVVLQLRHPNAGSRKDAFTSLKEVVVAGMQMAQTTYEPGTVIRAIGGAVNDDDSFVRKALLSFSSWYLGVAPKSTVIPYFPLLRLQVSSALSNIFPEIRIDACRFVSLLLDFSAGDVVGAWPRSSGSQTTPLDGDSTVFEGLRLAAGLGSESGSSTQHGFSMNPASKLVVLRTLLGFVSHAFEETKGEDKEIVARDTEAKPGSGWLAARYIIDLPAPIEVCDLHVGLEENESVGDLLATIYTSLHPLLLSTFMEAAPTAFVNSDPNTTSLDLCSVVTQLVAVFTEAVLKEPNASSVEMRKKVVDLTRRLGAWFSAATSLCSSTDYAVSVPGFALCLAYAKLCLALASSAPTEPVVVSRKGKHEPDGLQQVAEWISTILSSEDRISRTLPLAQYISLLPVITPVLVGNDAVIGRDGAEASVSVRESFFNHLASQGSTDPIRRQGNQLLFSLLASDQAAGQLAASTHLRRWMEDLPRNLWEVGAKDDTAACEIMAFLTSVAFRQGSKKQPSAVGKDLCPTIAAKIAPFFNITHPTRGSVSGPWSKLRRAESRRLALNMAAAWIPWDEGRLKQAVDQAVAAGSDDDAAVYWSARFTE